MSAIHPTDLPNATIEDHDPPGLGRAIAISCGILCPLVFIGSTILMMAMDHEPVSALAFGLFIAVSAGLGFGVLIGGAVYGSKVVEGH